MNEKQLNIALHAMSQQRNQAMDEAVKLQVQIVELQNEVERLRSEAAKPASDNK